MHNGDLSHLLTSKGLDLSAISHNLIRAITVCMHHHIAPCESTNTKLRFLIDWADDRQG